MRYTGDMSPKTDTLNIRCSSEWKAAAEEAASRMTRSMPGKISRNGLIEYAVVKLMRDQGWDDLADRADTE